MSYSRRAHSLLKAVHNKKKAVFPPVRFIWANQYIYNSLGVAVPPVRDIPAEMVAVSRPLQVYHHSQRRPKSAQPPSQSCRRGRSRLTGSTRRRTTVPRAGLPFPRRRLLHLDAVKDPKGRFPKLRETTW